MKIRLVQVGNTLPISLPVDPNAQFEPGMIGQLWLSVPLKQEESKR